MFIAYALYLVVAACCFVNSVMERTDREGFKFKGLAVSAVVCLFWPIAMAAVAFTVTKGSAESAQEHHAVAIGEFAVK